MYSIDIIACFEKLIVCIEQAHMRHKVIQMISTQA